MFGAELGFLELQRLLHEVTGKKDDAARWRKQVDASKAVQK